MHMVRQHNYHPEFIADRTEQRPSSGCYHSNGARVASFHHENEQNRDQQRDHRWHHKVASAYYPKDSMPKYWPIHSLAGQLHR